MVIFPEGTRTRDGRLGPFKRGAVVPARKARVPIVPCAIRGSFAAWPRQRRLPHPGRLEAVFGPAIDARESDAMDRAHEAVLALMGEDTPQAGGGAPGRGGMGAGPLTGPGAHVD